MTELRPAAGPDVTAELEVKKSRFVAIVRRANSVDEARALVADARQQYPGARHYCSAFVISEPGAQPHLHSNDDGEPAQTAGRPMLDVLVGSGLHNVAAVVVRWFGGTLLGTGGLVRAYSEATRLALDATARVRAETVDLYRLELGHQIAGRVESELRSAGVHVHDTQYGPNAVGLTVATGNRDDLEHLVSTSTAGAGVLTPVGQHVVEHPVA